MAQLNIKTGQLLDGNKSLFELFIPVDRYGNINNGHQGLGNIDVVRGNMTGVSGIRKYGLVEGTQSNGWSTIWTPAADAGTELYDWTHGNGTISVVSSDSGDNQTIRVEGLDANFDVVSEDIVLTGDTPVVGATTFSRVNRAYISTNTSVNAGDIDVSIGGTLVTRIPADYGQTLQCFYTIPAGKTGYLVNLCLTTSKQQPMVAGIFKREESGVFRVVSTLSLYQMQVIKPFQIPPAFPEKTDIELRIKGSTAADVSAEFELILIDN